MSDKCNKKNASVTEVSEAKRIDIGSIACTDILQQGGEGSKPGVEFPELIQRIRALDDDAYKNSQKAICKAVQDQIEGISDSQARCIVRAIREVFTERPKRPYEADPEPWLEDVDLLDVVTEIEALIRRVMYLRPECVTAVAYFCIATWFVEYIDYAPYMVITSPAKRCGKSTLLELMMGLIRRPYVFSGRPTESTLFRQIEKYCPALLVDEVDTFLKNCPELQGLLNGGIKRKLAFISRTESTKSGAKFVKDFSTFGFKVFSGIGAQGAGAALVDRAIVIFVERKDVGNKREKLRDIPEDVFETLKRKMRRLAFQYGEQIQNMRGAARPDMPEEFGDRDCDKWELICALADIAGTDEGRRVRDCAETIVNERGDEHWTTQLLADAGAVVTRASAGGYNIETNGVNVRICIGFDSKAGDYILSATLHNALTLDTDKPWIDFCAGRPISKSKISKTLSIFGAKPIPIRSEKNSRGFRVADIQTAVSLYAPGVDEQ